MVRPEGLSMKNSNDNIGNRSRDALTCSTVPQPTAPTRAPPVLSKLVTQAAYRTQSKHIPFRGVAYDWSILDCHPFLESACLSKFRSFHLQSPEIEEEEDDEEEEVA